VRVATYFGMRSSRRVKSSSAGALGQRLLAWLPESQSWIITVVFRPGSTDTGAVPRMAGVTARESSSTT
jgi:hypothetical protein